MGVFLIMTYYLGVLLFLSGVLRIFWGFNYFFSGEILFLEWDIFSLNSSSVIITLIFDWIRLRFIGLVIVISSIVLFYRTYYISGDKFFNRFILLVYLFVISMIFLILSPNIIRILLGWDGLGLVSYCLVIYYQNSKSANAGMVTILSNRIGDIAILLCIAWLLNFGSWNFFYSQFIYLDRGVVLITILVVLAAITKRAQMPFSAWLPAAIAAPTPVSALVHSSTLVTAGVYLLIRFNFIMGVRKFLFFVGVFTMFISGLGANFETDLKKIIALSTLRQLGLIIITLGLGLVDYSFFHLITHAIFKSLLFLCAGVFIHSMGDSQDIRVIGGLIISCPATSFYFICSSIALCGFPFLSGFYSKDIILELFFIEKINFFMFLIIVLATLFTVSYSVRLRFFIFFNNLGIRRLINLREERGMLSPMRVLLFLSVLGGGFMRVFIVPLNLIFIPLLLKSIILIGVIFIFFLYLMTLHEKLFFDQCLTNIKVFFVGSMWLLPFLTSVFFMPSFKIGGQTIKYTDQGWLEFFGGQGFINKSSFMASRIDFSNFLNLKFFLFIFFISLVFLIVVLFYLNSLNLRASRWSCGGNLWFLNKVNHKNKNLMLHWKCKVFIKLKWQRK